jgi:hypothetical protein
VARLFLFLQPLVAPLVAEDRNDLLGVLCLIGEVVVLFAGED